ncbi:hypothetical protein ACIA8G_06215 [Lentzea sp. NPDC051213]|uniref:hypothetical protein n=1 Tax=Lentzea sp. NPDC051213 TaxID=3364126 RepID=UPI0037AF4125
MRELLYVPEINPPEQVLHHAILYRDSISTLLPDNPDDHMSDQTKLARDAGVFRPRLVREIWSQKDLPTDALADHLRAIIREADQDPIIVQARSMIQAGLFDKIDGRYSFELITDARATVWMEYFAEMRKGPEGEPFGCTSSPPASVVNWHNGVLIATGLALAGRFRRDATAPLVVPCYPNEAAQVVRDLTAVGPAGHLLARVDVGRFLPEPPPGIDTSAVIAFRERYDDERRRLIRAVERLVKEAARAHGMDEPADIDRDVREELDQALSDMKQAGRRAFGSWMRRAAWFTVASSAGAMAGPIGAAAGSVAANWASNLIPQECRGSDYTYLYRLQSGLHEFDRTSG